MGLTKLSLFSLIPHFYSQTKHDRIQTKTMKEIEAEMARTQKNKATNYHLGTLKAKLAKLRNELLMENSGSSGGGGEGFDVARLGDARVALIGFPSVGKSTLLGALTGTESEAVSYGSCYEFIVSVCAYFCIHMLSYLGLGFGSMDGNYTV